MVAPSSALRRHTRHHQQPGAGDNPRPTTGSAGGGTVHHHTRGDGSRQCPACGRAAQHLAQRSVGHHTRLRRQRRHILGTLASVGSARQHSLRPARKHQHRDGTHSHRSGRNIPLHRARQAWLRRQVHPFRPPHHPGLDSAQAAVGHARRGGGVWMGRLREAV